jgi:Do/DeqQ family serine protease
MRRSVQRILKQSLAVAAIAGIGFAGGLTGVFFSGNQGGAPAPQSANETTDRTEHIQAFAPLTYSPDEETPAVPAALTEDSASMVARSFQEQFRKVSAATLPVVVEINVVNRVSRQVQPNPFEFFFGTPRQSQPQEREYAMRGMGSGVIVGRDGDTVYVLTNNHVAGQADEIEIGLYDGRSYQAELVGGDELIDLAMLSFETDEEVPIATLGDSEQLQPGDWVFAVGNPLGFESTITAGIVSATARAAGQQSGMSGVTDYIQTDAAINRGNSGGALVNLEGEVVGINTWIASNSGGSIGIGFAIPVNNARKAIEDFIQTGEVSYSWLGVQVSTLTSDYAEELGLDTTDGAFVTAVYNDSPAERSGILPGDTIITVNGRDVRNSNDLVRTVATLTPGENAPFEVIRDGRQRTITVRTGRRDAEAASSTAVWPGMSVAPITDEIREQLELDRRTSGVIISAVQQDSQAQQSGIRRGDIVTSINGRNVSSVREFYRFLGQVDEEEIQFRILRNGQRLILGFVRPTA